MRIELILPFALLADSVLAKPIIPRSLPKRKVDNSSISGITETSTGTPTSTLDPSATCVALYIPNQDETCGEIADGYHLHLSDIESKYPSDSVQCETILHVHGICRTSSTTSPSAFPTATLAEPIIPGEERNSTIDVVEVIEIAIFLTTLSSFETKTLPYTIGTGTNRAVRSAVVTHTSTDILTMTVTSIMLVPDTTSSTISSSTASVASSHNSQPQARQWRGRHGYPDWRTSYAVVNVEPTQFPDGHRGPWSWPGNDGPELPCSTEGVAPTILASSPSSTSIEAPVPTATLTSTNSPSPNLVSPTTTETSTSSTVVVLSISTTTSATQTTTSSVPTSTTTSSTTTSSSVSTPAPTTESTTVTSAVTPTATCSSTVSPPAPTQNGVVADCTLWYQAATGDGCATVAAEYGISIDTFTSWNPAVNGSTCPNMLVGYAYCVGTCGSPSTAVSSTVSSTTSSASTIPSSTTVPSNSSTDPRAYTGYYGTGTVADGWPSMDQWVDFDTMFAINQPSMAISCAAWGVPDDSDDEIAEMKTAIQSVAAQSNVIDPRLILAIIMQESTGCVRVITTQYSVFNPGLMQSHNGTGECNTNNAPLGIPGVAGGGVVQTPCPASEITQMIQDGTLGTSSGDGLEQIYNQQTVTDVSRWYRTARAYNGGSVAANGILEDGCCTRSYASDVANRLTGWALRPNTPRNFS